MRSNQRGQSTAEYAILLAVVVAAVVGMQLYVKRGMQGKFRDAADAYTRIGGEIGGAGSGTPLIGTTAQYEPYYTAAGTVTVNSNQSEDSTMAVGGHVEKSNINNTTTQIGVKVQGVDVAADDAWR